MDSDSQSGMAAAPSFHCFEEQLGLKLSGHKPVDVLVIDHIEKPLRRFPMVLGASLKGSPEGSQLLWGLG